MTAGFSSSELWPRRSPAGVLGAVRASLEQGDMADWEKTRAVNLWPVDRPAGFERLTLTMLWSPAHGFSLLWCRVGDGVPAAAREMVSVGDPARMDEMERHPAAIALSIGSCVPARTAIRVLDDFAHAPEVLSDAVPWRRLADVAYPMERG